MYASTVRWHRATDPAMISTPRHRASRRRQRESCQPGLYGLLLGTVSSCFLLDREGLAYLDTTALLVNQTSYCQCFLVG